MRRSLWMMGCAVLYSCASVEIDKVTDTTKQKGLRFYRPDPYLKVTQDEKGMLQFSIIYLPNRSEEYALRWTRGIGSIDFTATLDGGWNLTQLGTKVDSKVPEMVNALVPALKDVLGLAISEKPVPLDIGLYRIRFDCTTGTIRDLVPIDVPKIKRRRVI